MGGGAWCSSSRSSVHNLRATRCREMILKTAAVSEAEEVIMAAEAVMMTVEAVTMAAEAVTMIAEAVIMTAEVVMMIAEAVTWAAEVVAWAVAGVTSRSNWPTAQRTPRLQLLELL